MASGGSPRRSSRVHGIRTAGRRGPHVHVVITGATGNVGTSLVEALSLDPAVDSVLGIARRRPEWTPPKTTWVAADVRTAPLDELFRGADAVVHLAWIFQPTHDPVATWDNNVRGAERVFEAAARSGAGALVHASSVGVYRAGLGEGPADEGWPTDSLPTAAYGREKAYLERVLDRVAAQQPLLRVVRMRPYFLFRRAAASSQRRIFAGPFLPTSLLRRRLPKVPVPAGIRFSRDVIRHGHPRGQFRLFGCDLPSAGQFIQHLLRRGVEKQQGNLATGDLGDYMIGDVNFTGRSAR